MLVIVLILLYVAARVIWYLIPEIKRPPGIVTIPNEKAADRAGPAAAGPAAADRKTAEKEQKAADRIQLLNMDIQHYTGQYEQLERIEPKNLKQEIAIQEKRYRLERKIAAAALEMERLQTPE